MLFHLTCSFTGVAGSVTDKAKKGSDRAALIHRQHLNKQQTVREVTSLKLGGKSLFCTACTIKAVTYTIAVYPFKT